MTDNLVLALDMQQGWSNPAARRCPNNGSKVMVGQRPYTEHGNLQASKTGYELICGICGYNEPANDPRQ